jgi:hypothetical protein
MIRCRSFRCVTVSAWLLSSAAVVRGDVAATPGGIRFTHTEPSARSVLLAGSFNDWTGEAMDAEGAGVWSKVVRLGPGVHEYKFVVDGQWIADPGNPVTAGDFGNSAITVGAGGDLTSMATTANTPYSARILVSGRTIGIYKSRQNPEAGDRFELRRPSFDTDLGFAVHVNDVLDARILTNISNEAENVELYRTRLNFDRGNMHFVTEDLEGWAWDNDDVGTWNDPMHLVGDIGIYHHPFGFDTQGAMLRRAVGPVDARILYADRFADGGQGRPTLDPFFDTVFGIGPTPPFAELRDGRFEYRREFLASYRFTYAANDEDVLAVRAEVPWQDVTLAASARLDRGYNPGALGLVESLEPGQLEVFDADPSLPDSLVVSGLLGVRRTFAGTEAWRALGIDARWKDAFDTTDLAVEVLRGRAQIDARLGLQDHVFLGTTADTSTGEPVALFVSLEDPRRIDDDTFVLDDSWRVRLDAVNTSRLLGAQVTTGVELERHVLQPLATGLEEEIENRVWIWNARAERPSRWRGRALEPSLDLEFQYLDYDPRTPWEHQLWFDFRNFWLDAGEHEVEFERLTLLGGSDALILRPALALQVATSPDLHFRYQGTVAGPGFGREPSYVETLLQGTWRISPRWKLFTDARFVKYNSRPLDLDDSFNETFWELAYEVTQGVELALSWGVDPWVIDAPVNEYAYIGRDVFLFGLGASGATARTDYVSLAETIPEAESALADERVLQVEAIVRF